jgi:hypothetical protein
MKKLLLGVTSVFLAGALFASSPAHAADFYMIYVSASGDDYSVELMDPASIRTTADGHKTVRESSISPMDLWQDNVIEYDCSSYRYKTVSSIAHMAGGDTMDRSTLDGMVGVWDTAKPNQLAYLAHDTVCNWTSSKMTGNSVYSATDFETAEHRLSDRLFQLEYKK